jgi:hypothetical protein
MKKYLPVLISALILFSCQKEFTITDGTTPTAPGGGTSAGCNTYMPLTLGTTWTYDYAGNTDIVTVVAPDTVINGKTFKRTKSTYSNTTFLREENGNVYEFAPINGEQILLNILRANANVGDKWKDTVSISGLTEIFEHQMIEKNVSLQVDNLSFKDVIHMRFKVTLITPFSTDEIQTTDTWIGKCVGALQSKTVSYFGGASSDTIVNKLKSYTIK